MIIRRVNDDIAVADQITVADVGLIADQGFRAIVCNRPDDEAPDQTDYAVIASAAEARGIEVHWQPVVSGQVTDADGREFGRVVSTLPKPVLAYCRSGTRCVTLWSLSEAGQMPIEKILASARAAGYELAPLEPRLRALAGD